MTIQLPSSNLPYACRESVFTEGELYRATPVTSGVGKSMVVWTTGPQFR